MMNSFAPAATFSLSNNHGMSDNIVARVVAITNDRANVTGFGKRAIVANPGCKLLLPNKENNFELSNSCERGNLSLLRLSLLESKDRSLRGLRTRAVPVGVSVRFSLR